VPEKPVVYKTHTNITKFLNPEDKSRVWVFTTSRTKKDAESKEREMRSNGYLIKYVQDMETLRTVGHIIGREYMPIFRLSEARTNQLVEYIRYWDILRLCCGPQMATAWRYELMPPEKRRGVLAIDVHSPNYHACSMYDIDEVERLFRTTKLFQLAKNYPNMKMLRRPNFSTNDYFGTYCSQYIALVRKEGIRFNQQVQIRQKSANV